MKTEPLGDICKINPSMDAGLAFDLQCSFVPMEYVDDSFGIITRQVNRTVEEVKTGYTFFKDGDVLFAKITPCMENGKCAIARKLINGIGFGSTEFHVIRPDASLIPEWVFYFIRQAWVREYAERRMTGSAGQKRVPVNVIEELEIPRPSLPEQKRLAAILEKADRLRRMRQYAQQLSESLLESAFLKTFLEAEDAREWPLETVETLAKTGKNAIRTGPFGSQLLHAEFLEEGPIAVLGIDNVVQNRFVWEQQRFITKEKYQELKRYTVYPNDVLITIMGTCGKCAIVPADIPPAINTKHLCCITLDQSKCLPTYLQTCFLMHPFVLKQLGIAGRGAIMTGLNMGIIKELVIPRPPMNLQLEFDQIVRRHNALLSQQREAARQAEHLFQTLLHRAFRGEL